jgi:hypothetical protein
LKAPFRGWGVIGLVVVCLNCAACNSSPKSDGPTDQIAKQIINEWLQTTTISGMADPKLSKIERGTPMEATGAGGIPEGTILYPVRAVIASDRESTPMDFFFYKDEFNEWHGTLRR